jgi:hypothetical protein
MPTMKPALRLFILKSRNSFTRCSLPCGSGSLLFSIEEGEEDLRGGAFVLANLRAKVANIADEDDLEDRPILQGGDIFWPDSEDESDEDEEGDVEEG